jgi:hypothetical protein
MRRVFQLIAVLLCGSPVLATAEPLISVPFDFSRHAIGLQVTVRGAALYMLLDTGVDPSAIDLKRADALGLKVDRQSGSDPAGFGDSKGSPVYPSHIDKLAIGDRTFAAFDALASDLTGLSTSYGRKIDGIIGYSFLSDKIVLIDYPERKIDILANAAQANSIARLCRLSWTAPLKTIDEFPVIPTFRFGRRVAPVTIDTGSNGGIALFHSALGLPGLKAALTEKGTVAHGVVGFGPFNLSPGQSMILHDDKGSTSQHVANVGNRLFEALRVKMLLNYRARKMTFFGECADTQAQ